jgi:hypothetical protein
VSLMDSPAVQDHRDRKGEARVLAMTSTAAIERRLEDSVRRGSSGIRARADELSSVHTGCNFSNRRQYFQSLYFCP